MIQRHSIAYHISPESLRYHDNVFIGLHIENAIYGQRYFGYFAGELAKDRQILIDHFEEAIMEFAPEMPLVLVKATPDMIARRMKENPHRITVVPEADIREVLDEFETEFQNSSLRHKLTVDTTEGGAEENLAAFLKEFEPHLNDIDRFRILTHSARQRGEWI